MKIQKKNILCQKYLKTTVQISVFKTQYYISKKYQIAPAF